MLDYNIGGIEDFIKKNWCPTIIAYSGAEMLNSADGIYMGFVEFNTLPDLILRISIKRNIPSGLVSEIVFKAHQFVFQRLGFHTNEIQDSILEDSENLLEWQIKFLDTIEEFDKTHDLTVMDIFGMILLGLDPRRNRLETSETKLLEFVPVPEEDNEKEEIIDAE